MNDTVLINFVVDMFLRCCAIQPLQLFDAGCVAPRDTPSAEQVRLCVRLIVVVVVLRGVVTFINSALCTASLCRTTFLGNAFSFCYDTDVFVLLNMASLLTIGVSV